MQFRMSRFESIDNWCTEDDRPHYMWALCTGGERLISCEKRLRLRMVLFTGKCRENNMNLSKKRQNRFVET